MTSIGGLGARRRGADRRAPVAEVGATFRWRLIVSDDAGDPIDFSASTAKMQIRTERGGDVVIETEGALIVALDTEKDLIAEFEKKARGRRRARPGGGGRRGSG